MEQLVNPVNILSKNREVRKRIESIQNPYMQAMMKFQYLTAARISEVTGKYGFTISNYQVITYEGHPTLLIILHTAKRGGKERVVALPLEEQYEPWSQELLTYFEMTKLKRRKSQGSIFKYSPRSAQRHAQTYFKDIYYFIEKYRWGDRIMPQHERLCSTHALRHLRATELMMNYNFDQIDLAIYCGWKLGSLGIHPVDRYVELQWKRYYPKLLKVYS